MRAILLIMIILLAQPTHARLVWEDDKGFKLETSGWADNSQFQMPWTGVMCGLTIPHNGYFAILKPGALELMVNGKWVRDRGIIIADGCPQDARSGGDTNSGACNITNSSACDKHGGRIIIMVKIPRMFPTPSAKPTKARWVERKVMYNVQTYR